MRFLRSNTAVMVTVGPFYDKTDGVTIETALTITNERITITADTDDGSAPTNILDNVTGATSGTDNDLNYITGNDAGMMQLELSAANVNRLGRMFLSITDAANHVPVFHEFMVLNTALYDALFASSGGAIPNAVAGASAGLLISGTNAGTTTLEALTVTGATTLTGAVSATNASNDIRGCQLTNPCGLKKNTAVTAFTFFLVSSTDHATPKTGATVTAERSLDGAAFGACANAVSEIANGFYKLNLAAGDLNGDIVALKFTASGADQLSITIITEP